MIRPDWPAPDHICALTTTRDGGVSKPPYGSMNLATHVGDDRQHVLNNRRLLMEHLNLPAEPLWLDQQHGVTLVDVALASVGEKADGSYTQQQNRVCCVMTADCLPLLLTNQHGTFVAAVHVGWRGLLQDIIKQAVNRAIDKTGSSAENILAWLGPAIGAAQFEVGVEIRDRFRAKNQRHENAFSEQGVDGYGDRCHADIYQLARNELNELGCDQVYGGYWCTVTEQESFYSYRRDGDSGRMATLIWMKK